MQTRKKCGSTNAVDEVTCGWDAYNGSTKKWELQTEVKVRPTWGTERAAWEDLVTSHVNATASAGLRALCAQPYASLRDL